MITMSLRDANLVENFKAVQELKKIGFNDEEIQKLYDKQIEADNEKDNEGRLYGKSYEIS